MRKAAMHRIGPGDLVTVTSKGSEGASVAVAGFARYGRGSDHEEKPDGTAAKNFRIRSLC
jgi:hypothetical protein